MRQPSNNGVSLHYGATSPPYNSTSKHLGTDYRFSPDNYWYAPEAIKVTLVTKGATCGNQVDFESLDGRRKYRGCHSSVIYAKQGQKYPEGFRMARMGETGAAIGAHLHLVMWVDGKRVDPYATIESLKGDKMLTLNQARILAFSILGRDGHDGRKNALAGATDADLNKNHVGKKTVDKALQEFYQSTEGKNYREKTIPAVYTARDNYLKLLRTEEAKNAELVKANEIKDKEIERLKAQLGDSSKWEVFKALVKELLGR